MRRRPLGHLAGAVALLFAFLPGCSGPEQVVVNATFDDVADLTTNGSVKLHDVVVGRVAGISLTDENTAAVRMEVDPEIPLPADLSAQLRKTSVLGERYVSLIPGDGGGSWQSGDTIEDTEVIPELEELIATSTDLLAAVATDTLAGAIRSGADGLDGRGGTLGRIIDDLNVVTTTYNANSADLVRLLNGLDAFLADVGPVAALHGRALERSVEFIRVLAEEDDRLIDTIVGLRDLAATGEDIMTTHRTRIDDFFRRLNALTAELVAPEQLGALDRLFISTALHNHGTIRGVNNEHAQVVLDFIICGLNETPGDAVRACTDPPQGAPMPTPRPPQDY